MFVSTEQNVSVIVCTRNRVSLLRRCLHSLGQLQPAPLELVVVDQSDGGESGRVVAGFEGRLPGLRYLASPSRGLSRGRNEGIRASCGEILAFTDDDCLAHPDWVGRVAQVFAENPEVAAVTGGSLPDPTEASDPRILAAATWHPREPRIFRAPVDPGTVGGGFNLSFRRSWAEKIGLFDPDLGPGGLFRGADDQDFLHRILRAGGVVRYDPRVVVAHLPWRDGRTQSEVELEYGWGISAWALKRMREGDFFPGRVAVGVLLSQGRRALSGLVRGDADAARTGWAYLSGLGRGTAAWILARNSARAGRGEAAEAAPRA